MYTTVRYTHLFDLPGGQDGAIFGDLLFRFDASGNAKVYTLPSGELTGAFTLDRTDLFMPHSNAVCFGADRWDEADEFPLLYTNLYNTYSREADRREGVCCVYRLTRDGNAFNSRLVQILRIGFVEDRALWKSMEGSGDVRPYGNFAVDVSRRKLYAFVMRDADQVTRYFEFDLPAPNAGVAFPTCGARVVTLDKENITAQFDGRYSHYVQGACCREGVLYSVEGFSVSRAESENPPRMQVMDVVSGCQIGDIALAELGFLVEPEFVDFWRGQLCYSDAAGHYYALTLEK